jgi:hypothetical protein
MYENMLKTYAKRLTDVQEAIVFLDTRKILKKSLGKKGKGDGMVGEEKGGKKVLSFKD